MTVRGDSWDVRVACTALLLSLPTKGRRVFPQIILIFPSGLGCFLSGGLPFLGLSEAHTRCYIVRSFRIQIPCIHVFTPSSTVFTLYGRRRQYTIDHSDHDALLTPHPDPCIVLLARSFAVSVARSLRHISYTRHDISSRHAVTIAYCRLLLLSTIFCSPDSGGNLN